MKKNTIPALTLVVGFFLIYLVLIFCGLFLPPALPEVTENRPLSPPPTNDFTTEGKRRENLELFNSYLMDRIPLRNIFYVLIRTPRYFVFGMPADSEYIDGHDGFLLEKWDVKEYLPMPAFSAPVTESFMKHFENTRAYFEKLKIQFIYVMGPMKVNLYRDRLPMLVPPSRTRGEILTEEMFRRYPHNTVNLFSTLRNAETSHKYHSLFYRQDEHWSKEGAGLAADAILKLWNPQGVEWEKLTDTSETFLGDITAVMGLYRKETSRYHAPVAPDTWTDVPPAEVSAAMKDPFQIAIAHFSKARSQRRILVIGNSMGWNLYGYFGVEFTDVVFVRSSNVKTYSFEDSWVKNLAEIFKPDVVLFAYTEDKMLP